MKLDISWYINSCCSNKCVVMASSLIVSSLLNSGEARDPSDPLSEVLSKKPDKFMVSEDVSLVDIILLEDEPVPEKETVLLPSEFVVSVGECIAVMVLQYSAYICGGCQNNVVCYLKSLVTFSCFRFIYFLLADFFTFHVVGTSNS